MLSILLDENRLLQPDADSVSSQYPAYAERKALLWVLDLLEEAVKVDERVQLADLRRQEVRYPATCLLFARADRRWETPADYELRAHVPEYGTWTAEELLGVEEVHQLPLTPPECQGVV